MELVVRKNDLLRELQLFQGIVERKNTIPILANVLMEAKGDEVRMLATDLEVTPLTELLDPILERYRPRVTGRLTVTIPDDLPAVNVDQTFLSQALTNVFENAVTHSASDADLAVTARAIGDEVEIRVEDSAPGVSAEALPRLFDRFYRAPAAAAPSRRGVGLGLTVVRGLIEAMGGTVRASASDQGGLAITIRVPAAHPEPEVA